MVNRNKIVIKILKKSCEVKSKIMIFILMIYNNIFFKVVIMKLKRRDVNNFGIDVFFGR